MQNNKKLVEKYTKLISDSYKMRIDKDKASENQGIGKNLTKERSNTSSLIKIGQSPSQNPSILNHSPSPSSYGSIKQTMVNNQNARNPTSVYNKEKIKVASSRTPKILTPEQQAKYDAAEAAAVKASGGRGLVIFKNPNLPEAPPKYNSDQSGDSDGETKITENNKKLVEKYTKLISEASFLDTLGDINLNPFKLLGFGTSPDSSAQAQNGGGGFGGSQSGGGGFGGSQRGGGTREDRKRAMRDDQSVEDYGNMLNRASGIRDARLAKIDASRTPEAVAKRKAERIAKSKEEDVAMGITPNMTPAEIQDKRKAKRAADSQARVDSNARLSQDALDMIKANKDERDAIDNDPNTKKLRADAEARTAARGNADRGGTDQRGAASGEFTMRGGQVVRSSDEHYDNVQNANATGEWIDPNSPGGRVLGQERRAAVDDQRDQHGPKNIETARAEIRRDSARLEAEMRAEDVKKNGPPKNIEPGSELPASKPPSLARPGTLSRKTSGPQDKPDYGVTPGIARPSNVPRGVSPPSDGVPSLLGRPQPEPPDNTPIDAQGQQNLQNIKRALNPNTRPSPNERPSPNAGDQPFLGKPSSGLTRLANIPIQVKPGDRRRISASQLAREAQSRRA